MNKANYTKSVLKSVFLNFKRNKVRTFLTALGITVGVFAVVMLLAIGLGLRNFISQQFEGLGANIIAVSPGDGPSGGFSGLASTIRFDETDVERLNRIESLDYVVPAYIANANVSTGKENKVATIFATSHEYSELFALKLVAGRFFDKSQANAGSKVAYLGLSLAQSLAQDPSDLVFSTVRVRNIRIKVLGVIENIGIPDRDNAIFIPYNLAFKSFNPDKDFFVIYTGVKNDTLINQAKEEINLVMVDRYEEDEFSVFEPSELLAQLSEIFNALNLVLVALGSISLLVGGVGIMNIMYATVLERTREIGIRRAVGASKKDIVLQFLTESVLLSLLGGFMGILLALVLTLLARNFFPAQISPASVLLALVVSSGIGIIFGSLPALNAAKLTPIEAIRK